MIKKRYSLSGNRDYSNPIKFDFHVSAGARIKYQLEESLFSLLGHIVISDPRRARLLSEKINAGRREEGKKDFFVTAGMINSVALLHEIFHFIIRYYEEKENPGVFSRGLTHLKSNLSGEALDQIFLEYIREFPPADVFKGKVSAEDYLNGSTGWKSNREIILEEIILLNLENNNPAAAQLEELYSDKGLITRTKYSELIDQTERFFVTEKPFGPENLPLTWFLKKPLVESPYSLDGQLDYILQKWGIYVYDKFYKRILQGKDLIYEDLKLFLHHGGGEKGTPPVPVYDWEFFERLKKKLAAGEELTEDEKRFYYHEYEKFTSDIEWMPNVVMIAKNIFVWLDQLSKKYSREIKRLDQVPDEELDTLAGWHFTSLWLIGIWERSTASRKIKQIMGNPDAASSAYSLYDYVIANELGGEDSFNNLKDRAWNRGIRIASDMVPNHTGIYSKWVVEKPDYFIQLSYPPYPGYSFNGVNLSDDPRVEVRIEDKYYNHSDAAVVFQRRDAYTGDIRYIYHGNDGTHMPWNDTAQLNLLNPEVRETLIQTIMHVARKTPIIRFDAAMTLAKKHYQRLWFPQPGSGGAVPSRSDFGLTREEFDQAMPVEFWREVVDRINTEMPDTLLLAEAFWLMEGYFVRTLGMHRVYNSAFMHMMMKEENEKYRLLIKNTLEFNPEILKRYVNFMSNPDEETAVNQFGKGDKYFGVAVMMITMPGLPMFGHGQVEGFAEKYGMEYKRAYYNEFADDNLIRRHEYEIFPLIRRRYLFSQVENFELYDFFDNFGNINENVYAFSNRAGLETVLVIYNNSYSECRGTINFSVHKNYNGKFFNKRLSDSLGLKGDYNLFYAYRDHRTRLEFLLAGRSVIESGFFIALNGYEYRVCLDFREIHDHDGSYLKLYYHLSGRGVYSIEQERIEMNLSPFHQSLVEFLTPENIIEFKDSFPAAESSKQFLNEEKINRLKKLLNDFHYVKGIPVNKERMMNEFNSDLEAYHQFLEARRKKAPVKVSKKKASGEKDSVNWLEKAERDLVYTAMSKENGADLLLPVLLVNRILNGTSFPQQQSKDDLFDKMVIGKPLRIILTELGHHDSKIGDEIFLIKILTSGNNDWLWKIPAHYSEINFLNALFSYPEISGYLLVNEFKGVVYFNKERFETLLNWVFTLSSILNMCGSKNKDGNKSAEPDLDSVKKWHQFLSGIKDKAGRSGYDKNKFLNVFKSRTPSGSKGKISGTRTAKLPVKKKNRKGKI